MKITWQSDNVECYENNFYHRPSFLCNDEVKYDRAQLSCLFTNGHDNCALGSCNVIIRDMIDDVITEMGPSYLIRYLRFYYNYQNLS